MRVLELGWEYPPRISGGLGTACEGIVRGLSAVGVDVLLVLPRLAGGEAAGDAEVLGAADLEARGLGRVAVQTVASPLRPYLTAADYRAATERAPLQGGYGPDLRAEVQRYAAVIGDLARTAPFDVIHAHDWMTFPAALAARAASGKPFVAHLHASEWDRAGAAGDPEIRRIEAEGLAAADLVVCVSHFTRRIVERHYPVPGERIRVVHNAVRRTAPDAARAARGTARGAGPRRSGPPTVLFLGRLTRQKGPAFFIEAAELVHAARPDVRFLVAGDGDLKAQLVESSAAHGLARNVFFTGFLGPEDVERAYGEADVYVMPSVSEPFGIAPLEALALDVPVIVSRQSGVAEALPSAPKVDYWDVRDLAGKVLLLLERPELREALVASGQRDLERLRWETAAERLVLVFQEALRRAEVRV